ncbi:Protein N-acetyltransferase, RimJ/RimL family [Robiginitalea myxolifaciens]|uniref:Protein N-acetyltransferase, RimJ/RimL family n=1 Tax=Robiginitalea myxolifaciens TaxID=400055 RepID=A0A1I6HJQ9_9FLAO|nr:GNAT family N-acetyltransferase [Robiginitalea myxolifaciens]SFR54702.1 Protein N-acetyltransferase, RimJ/RimL family [Robiginitalea myxolifaciens]
MLLQPQLENERIRIRPLKAADREALYRVASDPGLWDQHPVKRYQRDVFDNFFSDSLASGGALLISRADSGEVIGSSRYAVFEGFPTMVEIGYTFLGRAYWGGKWNAMIKEMMLEHAFRYVEQVLFFVAVENFRSAGALKKIGAVQIPQEEYDQYPTKDKEYLLFAIKREEF